MYVTISFFFFYNRRTATYTRKRFTYMCEQTLEPAWVGQRFLLELPSRAAQDTRGVTLRVSVATRSVVKMSKLLGKADIHLTCLKAEEPVIGTNLYLIYTLLLSYLIFIFLVL